MRKLWVSFEVVLILAVLATFSQPVSADILALSTEPIPGTTGNTLVPTAGMSIVDMAVASDGTTIYAAMGTGGAAANQKLYKSTDGGFTWQALTTPNNAAADAVNLVAIAPDDPNIVTVLGNISPATGNTAAYVSTDGGNSFSNLNIPNGTWYDVTISSAREGIRYIGVSGSVAGPAASFQYINMGATAPVWTDAIGWAGGSFAPAATSIRTAAFSPSFASDMTFVAVSEEAGAAKGVRFHIASLSSHKWDTAAGFSGYPVPLTTATVANINSASIALDQRYVGSEDDSRLAFVGASIVQSGTGSQIGGTWRLTDTEVLPLNVSTGIKSVAWNSGTLVAGAANSNSVYHFEKLVTASPTISTTPAFKRPGGTANVIVAWAGPNVLAATTGTESAFSMSRDDAKSFNDISLINTTLTNLDDVKTATDASKVYLATDDGQDLSLWRKTDTWERVLVVTGDTGYMLRLAPDDKDTVYLAKLGSTKIYFTKDGGEHNWSLRHTPYDIQDLAVESAEVADIAYVAASNTAKVGKSSNGGFTWNAPVGTNLPGNIWSLASLGKDKLATGSNNGYVAYSTDGNATWTAINTRIEANAGNVQVTASGLASNDFIYATSDMASTGVWRWQMTQSNWKNMSAPVSVNFGAYGIGMEDGVLWLITKDRTPGSHNSQLMRTLDPSSAEVVEWSSIAGGQDFNAVPEALVLSYRAGSGTIVWLIDTFTKQLYSLTDPLSGMPPAAAPEKGSSQLVNPVDGSLADVAFTWARPAPDTTGYDLEIYADKSASNPLITVTVDSNSETATVIIGPHQTGAQQFNFAFETAYYWRVRTNSPSLSHWSSVFSFTTQHLSKIVPQLLSPANGARDILLNPAFSWSRVAGSIEYRFILSDNVSLAMPLVDIKVLSANYTLDRKLEPGRTYFWAVKTLAPIESELSTIASFTVIEPSPQPAPPLVTPPPVVSSVPPPPLVTPPPVTSNVPPPTETVPAPPPLITSPSPPPVITSPASPSTPLPQGLPAYTSAIIFFGGVIIITAAVLIFRAARSRKSRG